MREAREIVTIDGPSGAGKSTISRLVADRLGYTYLDTGGMYRAVALEAGRRQLDLESEAGRAGLETLLLEIDIRLEPAPSAEADTRVFLNGEDVSALVRTPEKGLAASRVSAEPAVRRRLTELQRELGEKGGIVAEGRDTGTVVYPGARYKFYLDAAPVERARRRYLQLRSLGQNVDYMAILEQIKKRDADDSSRSLAPLKPAADAVIIDSSQMDIAQVAACILDHIRTAAAS